MEHEWLHSRCDSDTQHVGLPSSNSSSSAPPLSFPLSLFLPFSRLLLSPFPVSLHLFPPTLVSFCRLHHLSCFHSFPFFTTLAHVCAPVPCSLSPLLSLLFSFCLSSPSTLFLSLPLPLSQVFLFFEKQRRRTQVRNSLSSHPLS